MEIFTNIYNKCIDNIYMLSNYHNNDNIEKILNGQKYECIKKYDKKEFFNEYINENYKKNLITIITPTFNQGKFITKTLESIEKQTYKNIQHIIFDNVSTDETFEIINKYIEKNKKDFEIIYIREKDFGQINAINKGFILASGEYITWLNSDDYYVDNDVLNSITNNNEKGIIYGKGCAVDEQGNIIRDYFESELFFNNNPNCLNNLFFDSCCILQPAVFIHKTIIYKLGFLLDEFPNAFDYEYWVRSIKNNVKWIFIDKYFAHAISYSDAKSVKNNLEQILECLQISYYYYKRISDNILKHYIAKNDTNENDFKKCKIFFTNKFKENKLKFIQIRNIKHSKLKNILTIDELEYYYNFLYILNDTIQNNYNDIVILESNFNINLNEICNKVDKNDDMFENIKNENCIKYYFFNTKNIFKLYNELLLTI